MDTAKRASRNLSLCSLRQAADLPRCPRSIQVNKPLVTASPKPQRDIFLLLHKSAIHQDIQQRQDLVSNLASRIRSLRLQFFQRKTAEGPYGFIRIGGTDPAEKRQQTALVFRFKGFSPQQSQAADIGRGKLVQKKLYSLLCKGLTILEIPRLGLKAILASVGTARDKQ